MMNRKMLKQAQQLQKRMEQMQEEMETLTVEGSAGGGAVTATVTGKMHVLSITIDPDVVDPGRCRVASRHGAGSRQRRSAQSGGDGE